MPRRRFLQDTLGKPAFSTGENQGMGQQQPVQQPGAMGAQQQGQPQMGQPQQPQPPPIQPLPGIPGMSPMTQATPGGGGANTDELMKLLMSLTKGGGSQGY